MKFVPLDDVVAFREIRETRTAGGLVLPETYRNDVCRGKVVAVGPGKPCVRGPRERAPMGVRAGDEILVSHFSTALRVTLDGEDLYLANAPNVLGILERSDGGSVIG